MGKVIIMRGLPGAGKSHWVRSHLLDTRHSVAIVSADHYHYEAQPNNTDGTLRPAKYVFRPE